MTKLSTRRQHADAQRSGDVYDQSGRAVGDQCRIERGRGVVQSGDPDQHAQHDVRDQESDDSRLYRLSGHNPINSITGSSLRPRRVHLPAVING